MKVSIVTAICLATCYLIDSKSLNPRQFCNEKKDLVFARVGEDCVGTEKRHLCKLNETGIIQKYNKTKGVDFVPDPFFNVVKFAFFQPKCNLTVGNYILVGRLSRNHSFIRLKSCKKAAPMSDVGNITCPIKTKS